MDKLRSCPFCGSTADIRSEPARGHGIFIWCECRNCGARGVKIFAQGGNLVQLTKNVANAHIYAADAWNGHKVTLRIEGEKRNEEEYSNKRNFR